MKSRALQVAKRFLIVFAVGIIYALVCRFTGFRIKCPIKTLTGFSCPGCGVTRMMLAISELKFVKAFYYNPVVFCCLPVLCFIKAERSCKYIKYGEVKTGKFENILLYIMLFTLIVFGIVRNII